MPGDAVSCDRGIGRPFLSVPHILEGPFPKPREDRPLGQTSHDGPSGDADKVALCDNGAGSLPTADPPLWQGALGAAELLARTQASRPSRNRLWRICQTDRPLLGPQV